VDADDAGVRWRCWFCIREFAAKATRNHHMSARHPNCNRLVPPQGFIDLHLQYLAVEHRRGAVVGESSVARGVFDVGAGAASVTSPAPGMPPGPGDCAEDGPSSTTNPTLGGLGVVRVAVDGYTRGTLPVRRPRTVFQTSTVARIRAYYEAMPEASRTKRIVPPSVGELPSRFNTPLLRQILKFALSAGGAGLSQADQRWYASVMLLVERGGVPRPPLDERHDGGRRRKRTRGAALVGNACRSPTSGGGDDMGSTGRGGEASGNEVGEVERNFPTKSAFVAAVRDEQRRVLSKLCWDETPLVVEGASYTFYSRDLLIVALDLLKNARHVQLWGEELGVGPDGTRLRSDMMDSDLLLSEEVIVRRRHGSHSFVLAVQLFIDEAVVSWSGAHYIYPVRARVLNVRDRAVQWVTVGYVPHVGKPVARTAAARRRARDTRNGVLQRCLAVLLRRFVGASQDGVAVEFPGRRALTAVPRLVGLVTDQLAERSLVCLMGNACEFFCSHCVVRRDVAGGPNGVGAAARDVTAVLDDQLQGAIARDADPRPSLRNQLRAAHSALAFVPAIGAVWGMATDNKRLYDVISFDLLHVWKLGVVRTVTQRFPSFLGVACAGQDARLGPVPSVLEALNLRAWEMGHLCVPSPTPPGYVLALSSLSLAGLWCSAHALWP